MTGILAEDRAGITVLKLVGELGSDQAEPLRTALDRALGCGPGRVVLDLRATVHLHYRVAGQLVRAGRRPDRVRLVGPTSYVRQILRFAGALDGDLPEYRDLDDALGDTAA